MDRGRRPVAVFVPVELGAPQGPWPARWRAKESKHFFFVKKKQKTF
jgi:hypothetical protein